MKQYLDMLSMMYGSSIELILFFQLMHCYQHDYDFYLEQHSWITLDGFIIYSPKYPPKWEWFWRQVACGWVHLYLICNLSASHSSLVEVSGPAKHMHCVPTICALNFFLSKASIHISHMCVYIWTATNAHSNNCRSN